MRVSRPCRGEAGFTLIELLVSLTLLAMILALMPGALGLGRRAWETAEQLERSAGAGPVMALVERRLASAMPLFERDESGGLRTAFAGEARRVSFVAPDASGRFGGGLYRLEFGARESEDGGGAALTFRQSFYAPGRSVSDATPLEDRDVIGNLEAVTFRYFGPRENGARDEWAAQWTRTDRLPSLVELSLVSRDSSAKPVTPLVVELRLRPAG